MNEPSPTHAPARLLISLRRLDVLIKYWYAKAFLNDEETVPENIRRFYRDMVLVSNGGIEPDRSKRGLEQFESSFQELIADLRARGFNASATPVSLSRDGSLLEGGHRVAACLALDIPVPVAFREETAVWRPTHRYFLRRGLWPEWLESCMALGLRFSPSRLRLCSASAYALIGTPETRSQWSQWRSVFRKRVTVDSERLAGLAKDPLFQGWMEDGVGPLEEPPFGEERTRQISLIVEVEEPVDWPIAVLREHLHGSPVTGEQGSAELAGIFEQLLHDVSRCDKGAGESGRAARGATRTLSAGSRTRWYWCRCRIMFVGAMLYCSRVLVPYSVERWLANRWFRS